MLNRGKMPGKKILVISKKSTLELAEEHNNQHILDLVKRNDASVAKLKKAESEHRATLKYLKNQLEKRMVQSCSNIEQVTFKNRSDQIKDIENYDLILSVGGDGTFLWVSKFVPWNIPILGINSDPSSSVGFFTCTDRLGIPRLLHDIDKNAHMPEKIISRLSLKVNGQIIADRILNDVLFAAQHPAAMTNYILSVPTQNGVIEEEQKSSGIWISTAAGSTGAILSAGGWILGLEDSRSQFVVREPMKNFVWGTEHHFIHGLFSRQQSLKIVNKTRKAILAIDGTTNSIEITVGDVIEITNSKDKLIILGK